MIRLVTEGAKMTEELSRKMVASSTNFRAARSLRPA